MRRIRLAAATVIATAVAVTVIAVPAASAGVRKYDTKLTVIWRITLRRRSGSA